MTTTDNNRGHRKSFRSVVGIAHHALRAYAKAYTLQAQSATPYRYRVPLDGKIGSILDPDGKVVAERPIEEWAAEGPAVRRALIGLKSMKERVEKAASLTADGGTVRFQLDILQGRATLSSKGVPLGKSDLLNAASELNIGDNIRPAIAAASDSLSSLSDWASIGRQFEVDFYQILQSAEKYGLTEAAARERERGYRLGIIRPKL